MLFLFVYAMNFNEKLIELVKPHEIIYDIKNKSYRNVKRKNAIWDDIGHTLNSTGSDCLKKWKGLRDTYKKFRRREQLSAASAVSMKRKWKYADMLRFLDNFQDQRISTTNAADSNKDDPVEIVSGSAQWKPARPLYTSCSLSTEPTIGTWIATTSQYKADNIDDIMQPIVRNNTAQLFASLANKIVEANLPPTVVLQLEAKVSQIVYETILKNINK